MRRRDETQAFSTTNYYSATGFRCRLQQTFEGKFEGKVVKIFAANTSPDGRILYLQLDSGEHLSYQGSMPIHLNKHYTFLVDTSAGYAYPFILSVRLLEEKADD